MLAATRFHNTTVLPLGVLVQLQLFESVLTNHAKCRPVRVCFMMLCTFKLMRCDEAGRRMLFSLCAFVSPENENCFSVEAISVGQNEQSTDGRPA